MRLLQGHNGLEQTVELADGLDGRTVADLAAALVEAAGDGNGSAQDGVLGVRVDGRWHSPDTPLSSVELWEGSRVEAVPAPGPGAEAASPRRSAWAAWPSRQPGPGPDPPEGEASLVVAVTGGLRSGVGLAPPPGRRSWVIGRGPGCDMVIDDPAVSRRHARVSPGPGGRPVIGDLGSRNGTALEGRAVSEPTQLSAGTSVRLGATRLEWRPSPGDTPAALSDGGGAVAGRVPFNRPPRRRPPMTPASLRVPAKPPDRPDPEPLSWAGIILPVAAGLVLAVLWSPFMAVFAVLGPVLAIGTWLERRRRAAKAHRRACEDAAGQIGRLAASLPAVRAAERRRRVALVPDPAEIVRRACAPSVRCWERRLGDPDAMKLGIGTAGVPFAPPLEISGTSSGHAAAGGAVAAPGALAAIEAMGPLADVPVAVSLTPGEVVGIVGPRAVARSVARALLVQAAVLHGPADLAVAVLAPGRLGAWGWARWLPHTADSGGGHGALVATEASAMPGVAELVAADASGRARLLVIDGAVPLTGRAAAGRALLPLDGAAGIVMASDLHRLPSSCTTVVEVEHSAGGLRLTDPRSSAVLGPLIAWGMTVETASEAAAGLARLDDPEHDTANAGIPDKVALVDLVGGDTSAEAIRRRWDSARGASGIAAPIGADGGGPVEIDLVADGPHVLVGGTTGSGKSELLRTLVTGLALSADPEQVAFVLVDYKGGAAFDRCADMPHVAGMVTDLDDRLAERALVCLEAELRYREERLRAAGVDDLSAFRGRGSGGDPLPRLVIVVDEFATLAAELPEFLDSLVGVAQRGRSLGVHMVLATQRPAGVVTDDIRANTSCRIALRVTDRHDSNDVIGAPDAAAIPRRRPGRALARFGPGELVAFQTALVTGVTPPAGEGLRVAVVDARTGRPSRPRGASGGGRSDGGRSGGAGDDADGGRSDLDRIAEALRVAHRSRGGRPPRSPWPAPLPEEVSAETLAALAGPGRRAAWLVDDPARQRRFADGWQPGDGHLVVIGGPASGTSTTLASVVVDLCRTRSAGELHIYAIDLDSGLLPALEGLPQVGSVVRRADSERRTRLLRLLDDEIASRRASRSPGAAAGADAGVEGGRPGGRARPDIVLIVDNLAGLARAHDPVRDPGPHERFARIWSNGPAVGVRAAVSIGRAADLSPDLAASAGVVLLHATTDAGDGLRFGLRAGTASLGPGRAVRADDGREVLVARPPGGDFAAAAAEIAASCQARCDAAAAGQSPAPPGPMAIGVLPAKVTAAELPVGAVDGDRCLDLRFAMCDLSLEPTGFALHDGEHALVLGPPRTGRTAALAAIGAAARQAGTEVEVVADRPVSDLARRLGVAPVRLEALGEAPGPRGADPRSSDASDRGAAAEPRRRRLLLIDEADRLRDTADGTLARIAGDPDSRDHLVAAVTADRLRSSYGHWLTELRSCRTGVLFRPGPLDGDLLGVALPPRLQLAPCPGRGLIAANGAASAAQVALVDR